MDFSQIGNSAAQAAVQGGMRTTSTMQRPSDNAANARARARRRKKKNRGNYGQLSAQDMIALFQSMPTPNRGFRRPGGDQPDFLGGGLDQFYAKNPSIAQGPARAGQIAAERQQQTSRGFEAGRAAVDFAKQTKGYTDAQGNFVPPTMPATPSSNYGTGSVAFTDKPTRGTMTDPLTGKQVFMDEYLPQQSLIQDSKYGAMPGQENGGALAKPRVQQPVTQAAQPQNDMTALFPGPNVAPMPTQIQPTFAPGDAVFVGLPMDTPGAASDMARRSSPFLPQGQSDSKQANVPAGPSWFDQKVAANPDGIFSKIAEVGGMMPEMPQMPALSQNGVLPDLWNGLVAGGLGVGDIYANTLGRPLDQFLFGIQPPAEPSNNMEQYQKSKNMKQGWW